MSKGMPIGFGARAYYKKVNTGIKYNGYDVIAYDNRSGRDMLFSIDDVVFEIHKMTHSKNGGINFNIVAWYYEKGDKKIWFNQSNIGNAYVKGKKWKYKAFINRHTRFINKTEVIEMVLPLLSDYQHVIINGLFS